jgi:hypothetical protein
MNRRPAGKKYGRDDFVVARPMLRGDPGTPFLVRKEMGEQTSRETITSRKSALVVE